MIDFFFWVVVLCYLGFVWWDWHDTREMRKAERDFIKDIESL